jgi:hypothetical protein
MKKSVLCPLILFLALASSAFGQAYHLDFDAFPADVALRAQVTEFGKIYQYVSSWRAEWKFDVPRDKAIAVLNASLAAADKAIAGVKEDNLDLLLFRALVKECLYNMDTGNYFNDIVTELKAVEKKYPADYRGPWLLANHLVYSGNPFDAIREYERLVTDVLGGNVPSDVFVDYCSALYMAMMFSTCNALIDLAVTNGNIAEPRKTFWMYDQLKAHFKESVPGVIIPKEELFNFLRREKGVGFLCRPFGAWLPVKEDWNARPFDSTPANMGSFMASVPLSSAPGRRIFVSLSVIFQALPQKDFTAFTQSMLKSMKNPVPLADWKGKWEATAYEFRDPALYKENGGGHGLIVFVKRGQPRAKGMAIEEASTIVRTKDDSGLRFYALQTEYARFDGDLYYAFLLDSCEAVFDQSKTEFLAWLDGVLLD